MDKLWFMSGVSFRTLRNRERVAAIRAQDGDNCWRCGHPMVFDGRHPNRGRAATIEHVNPLSKGGSDHFANLRLCHVGCNRFLADHEPAQKERMRTALARKLFLES